MTMTNDKLAEAVARIFEADANRTPGEWSYEPQDFSPERVWAGTRLICHVVGDSAETQETAAFIATAPLMVRIIRQLWAEREQQRAAMVKAKEALEFYRDFSFADGGNKATKALAALESAGV
jgi:hypothetical protein